jgi:hypothetical protein
MFYVGLLKLPYTTSTNTGQRFFNSPSAPNFLQSAENRALLSPICTQNQKEIIYLKSRNFHQFDVLNQLLFKGLFEIYGGLFLFFQGSRGFVKVSKVLNALKKVIYHFIGQSLSNRQEKPFGCFMSY